mgnify:FL=1|jgi:hypothetical protein|nr:MAG TPA: UV excision repair protein [Caudoviricetes sp.]
MNILNSGMPQMNMSNLPPRLMQSIQQLKQMQAMCNGDINTLVQRVVAKNPQMAQAMQMVQGQNPEALVKQMCKQKGIDFNALMQALKG